MKKIYDQRCNDCEFEFEVKRLPGTATLPCERCGSRSTIIIWKTVGVLDKAKSPYEYLDGPIPDSKPIKSFARDRRVGGKDR